MSTYEFMTKCTVQAESEDEAIEAFYEDLYEVSDLSNWSIRKLSNEEAAELGYEEDEDEIE